MDSAVSRLIFFDFFDGGAAVGMNDSDPSRDWLKRLLPGDSDLSIRDILLSRLLVCAFIGTGGSWALVSRRGLLGYCMGFGGMGQRLLEDDFGGGGLRKYSREAARVGCVG